MLPTLSPASASWKAICQVIVRGPRLQPRCDELPLLVPIEDVARAFSFPIDRDPLPVLDLHGDQAKVSDVVLAGERARRGDAAHPVFADGFERIDELAGRKIESRPLEP